MILIASLKLSNWQVPFRKYVFGWGDTRAGQLGRVILTATPPDDQPVNMPRPVRLSSLDDLDITSMAAGNFHAAVVVEPQVTKIQEGGWS